MYDTQFKKRKGHPPKTLRLDPVQLAWVEKTGMGGCCQEPIGEDMARVEGVELKVQKPLQGGFAVATFRFGTRRALNRNFRIEPGLKMSR